MSRASRRSSKGRRRAAGAANLGRGQLWSWGKSLKTGAAQADAAANPLGCGSQSHSDSSNAICIARAAQLSFPGHKAQNSKMLNKLF